MAVFSANEIRTFLPKPALLILWRISSSSPPQPQNLLEYPLTFLKSLVLIALTPPNISLYGNLYLNLSIAEMGVRMKKKSTRDVLSKSHTYRHMARFGGTIIKVSIIFW